MFRTRLAATAAIILALSSSAAMAKAPTASPGHRAEVQKVQAPRPTVIRNQVKCPDGEVGIRAPRKVDCSEREAAQRRQAPGGERFRDKP